MVQDLWMVAKDGIAALQSLDAKKRAEIARYLRVHWRGLLLLVAVAFVSFYANEYWKKRPERTIAAFYASLNQQDFSGAWNMLSRGYQKDLGPFEKFKAGYNDVATHTSMAFHTLGIANNVAAVFHRVNVISRSEEDDTTMPEEFCYLTRLQKERLPDGYEGRYSVKFGRWLLVEDWRIVINNHRGICNYFGI